MDVVVVMVMVVLLEVALGDPLVVMVDKGKEFFCYYYNLIDFIKFMDVEIIYTAML